ncbi:latent-transforming growth factor beta-binding protein 4-like, partial [Nothoprocta perdicaria]|uniref:latent-transforming growth factor beta-binding protein 4-like n=1 Tax=Nothoprocta perdicaria TaxID=30464 RepID=UPI000E1BA059
AASMVSVHVQHPPEASVTIHQVERVREGEAAPSAPPGPRAALYSVLAQSSPRVPGYGEGAGYGYCFRQLRNGECSSPLPGLRTQEICCRGAGVAWGVHECQPCEGDTAHLPAPQDSPCPKGFQRSNGSCVDVDECQAGGLCQNGLCSNTRGSFACLCHAGYILDSSRSSCISPGRRPPPGRPPPATFPPPVPEVFVVPRPTPGPPPPVPTPAPREGTGPAAGGSVCERNPQVCGPGRCVPRQGGYTCLCHPGFWLSTQGTHCIDVDECRRSPRPCANGRCENSVGSYRCVCNAGYRAAGTECQDIDECAEQPCAPGHCENTAGSYRCVCPGGYRPGPDGAQCVDVDECERGDVCAGGRCANTEGSFECRCPAGFRTGAEQARCQDVDECQEYGAALCGAQRCENIPGSYRCVARCPPGYRPGASGECADVDECQ